MRCHRGTLEFAEAVLLSTTPSIASTAVSTAPTATATPVSTATATTAVSTATATATAAGSAFLSLANTQRPPSHVRTVEASNG